MGIACALRGCDRRRYSAAELRSGGFTAKEHKAAGFSVAVLREVARFSADELEDVGFTVREVRGTP